MIEDGNLILHLPSSNRSSNPRDGHAANFTVGAAIRPHLEVVADHLDVLVCFNCLRR
jgi:hypothetical protein